MNGRYSASKDGNGSIIFRKITDKDTYPIEIDIDMGCCFLIMRQGNITLHLDLSTFYRLQPSNSSYLVNMIIDKQNKYSYGIKSIVFDLGIDMSEIYVEVERDIIIMEEMVKLGYSILGSDIVGQLKTLKRSLNSVSGIKI